MCVCYNPRIVSRDRAFHIQILLCSLLRTAVLLCFLLHLFPLSYACDEELRTVSIKVAADEEFRSQSDWQLKAKRLISRSSARFKNEFSIRFHIEKFVFWNSDNSADSLFELLHDLRKKISHEGCDVVMGLTSQGQQGMEFEYSGIAAYLNSTVLLRELPSESTMERMMAHEFGHLFGAADLHEKGSLMDEEKPGEKFDTFTRSLIVLNKQRDFNPYVFPLSEGKLDKAAALYKKRKSLGLREDSVGMLLAVFYLEMEDYSSMMEECLDLIGKNPDSPEAHNLMGIVLRRTGRIDEAVAEYEKALALQARFPELHYNLGIALMKKGLLEKARRLDEIGLDHGELSRAHRHIIVSGGEPRLIDFESASTERRVSNITSLTQYLFINRRMRRLISRVIEPPEIQPLIEALKRYKQEPSEENYRRILEVCGL